MRDKAYEQEINNVQQEMLLMLDDLHNDIHQWNGRDLNRTDTRQITLSPSRVYF